MFTVYKRTLTFKIAFDFSQSLDEDDERKLIKAKLETFVANELAGQDPEDPEVESAVYKASADGEGETNVKIVIEGKQSIDNKAVENRVITALESETFPSYVLGSIQALSIVKQVIIYEDPEPEPEPDPE